MGVSFFFYAQSPRKWVLSAPYLTLKKGIGKIEIPISSIKQINRIPYTPIPLTTGSMGFFGYLGNSMDGYKLFVGDEKNMFHIDLGHGKIRSNCQNPDLLISLIKELLNENKGAPLNHHEIL